jgi:hypothetical protein
MGIWRLASLDVLLLYSYPLVSASPHQRINPQLMPPDPRAQIAEDPQKRIRSDQAFIE